MAKTIQVGPRRLVMPDFSLGPILLIGAIVVLLAFFATSVYTINPEEQGVVLRFGKFIKKTGPGLHFKLPFGVDRVATVPVRRQEKLEFGFRSLPTKKSGSTSYVTSKKKPYLLNESLMVTGDLNAAVVEWIIQYRIPEPEKFLFNVRNPEETLFDASESVMREVVGDRTIDEVLTVGRAEIAQESKERLQAVMDEYQMGIRIEAVVLQDVNPPARVQPSFEDVNQAQQDRERLINEAQAEYNKIIPQAKGEAEQSIKQAEGYALERVNQAMGDATRFIAMFEEYRKAPEVTRTRIYLETMEAVIPKMGRKIVVDERTQGILPLLQLNPTEAPKQ